MKSICKDQINRWQITNIFGIIEHIQDHPLDRSLGSYRHKDRCLQGDAIEGDFSNSCISSLFKYPKFEFIHHIIFYIKAEYLISLSVLNSIT